MPENVRSGGNGPKGVHVSGQFNIQGFLNSAFQTKFFKIQGFLNSAFQTKFFKIQNLLLINDMTFFTSEYTTHFISRASGVCHPDSGFLSLVLD